MGATDIRRDRSGNTDFRLDRQLRSYAKEDPPSARVKPVPIQVVVEALRIAYAPTQLDDGLRAVADMICIGYYYLMRPGEHTKNSTDTAFRLIDVALYREQTRLNLLTAPVEQLQQASSLTLEFTTQKNGVKGEKITHGRSGHPLACPVLAVVRRVCYHRLHQSPNTSPLCQYYDTVGRVHFVRSKDITVMLQTIIRLWPVTYPTDPLDIQPHEVTARALRAGGATALLVAGVDTNTVQLVGRWKSDAMIRYLHVMATPAVHTYAAKMYSGGHYSFRPGLAVPVRD